MSRKGNKLDLELVLAGQAETLRAGDHERCSRTEQVPCNCTTAEQARIRCSISLQGG